MALPPVSLSAALPSELLAYIVRYHIHPTTLIICFPRSEFVSSLIEDIHQQSSAGRPGNGPEETKTDDLNTAEGPVPPILPGSSLLLTAPLHLVAVARHIRLVFMPSVSHLRGFLSVFSAAGSSVAPPPAGAAVPSGPRRPPALVVYGFLGLHRHTSEWSAQGISNSASVLVEVAASAGLQPVLVERLGPDGGGRLDRVLREYVSILGRGVAGDDDGVWSGRTVAVRRVLSRWFRFETAEWETKRATRAVAVTGEEDFLSQCDPDEAEAGLEQPRQKRTQT